jgi:hypothetical protein
MTTPRLPDAAELFVRPATILLVDQARRVLCTTAQAWQVVMVPSVPQASSCRRPLSTGGAQRTTAAALLACWRAAA